MKNKKITKATFKSFIRKNLENLYIREDSRFDGMVDCVMPSKQAGFAPLEPTNNNTDHTLGICGIWLVGQSRDYFNYFNNGDFEGIETTNCCGRFIIAIKK